jgi:nicotinamidase-related amidase
MNYRHSVRRIAAVTLVAWGGAASAARAQSIIEEWSTVQAPPPPPIGKVAIEPATTALLVLDIAKQTCNAEQRPRCVAMLPRLHKLLAQARSRGLFVVYTLGAASTPADILPEVAMLGGEPVVKSAPDKFVATDLEKILKDKGIKTVIAVGAAAHGAVLHTATGAAFRGFNVVVPVDGMAAETPYAEQYTTWDLANAPRLADKVKLTKIDMIE